MSIWILFALQGCSYINETDKQNRLDSDRRIKRPEDCDDPSKIQGAIDWYLDEDGDGYGAGEAESACAPPTEKHVAQGGDCNDQDRTTFPNAREFCDGIDNDCNGLYDDEDDGIVFENDNLFYIDSDGDGFGDPSNTIYHCQIQSGEADIGGDCDDSDPYTFPGAAPMDSDWRMTDEDGDGYGSDSPLLGVLAGSDCNDFLTTAYPEAPELCDFQDNDCNGVIDEGTAQFYRDADADGYGTASDYACQNGSGYVENSEDCDDSSSAIAPNLLEICDEIDNNCDGFVDEGVQVEFYRDGDGDGYGDPLNTTLACIGNSPTGYILIAGDCDDSSFDTNPSAIEVCDGTDNNCNGLVDVNAIDMLSWFLHSDGDGFGAPGAIVSACQAPSGYSSVNTDCDDSTIGLLAHQSKSQTALTKTVRRWDPHTDVDNDGFAESSGSTLISSDLDCDDDGEGASTEPLTDCDDNNASEPRRC